VQIGVSVVAVVVKTERLALTVVILCQCREMDVKEEQRAAIEFCCKVDFSVTKTVELIHKAYGDAVLSRTTIFEWHKRFREGRKSVKDDERCGRSITSRTDGNIAAVDKMVKEDRNVTSRLIADTLGIPKTVVLRILREDLKKRKLYSRFVPHALTREQMDERVAEFVQEGCTVNVEYYKGVLDRLISRIRRVRPALYRTRKFFLLHDKAPAHSAAKIRQFLTQKQVTTLNHHPYSPHLSPPDYFLFPKVKLQLKGARFDTIQKAVTKQLNKIPAEDFSNAMKKLETRANLCITSNGSYFE